MLANPGLVANPVFQLLLVLGCAGLEALAIAQLMRRRELPRARVQVAVFLLNMVSWVVFYAYLASMRAMSGASFLLLFVLGEVSLVLLEAVSLPPVLAIFVPRALRARIPAVRKMIPLTLLSNTLSVAAWFALMVIAGTIPNRSAFDHTAAIKAEFDVRSIEEAAIRWCLRNATRTIPTMEQLTTKDETGKAYLEMAPMDPWGNKYLIRESESRLLEVVCLGPDGIADTEDDIVHNGRR